jgi:hypothetical protein
MSNLPAWSKISAPADTGMAGRPVGHGSGQTGALVPGTKPTLQGSRSAVQKVPAPRAYRASLVTCLVEDHFAGVCVPDCEGGIVLAMIKAIALAGGLRPAFMDLCDPRLCLRHRALGRRKCDWSAALCERLAPGNAIGARRTPRCPEFSWTSVGIESWRSGHRHEKPTTSPTR